MKNENSMEGSDGSTRKIFTFRALICLGLLILTVPGITHAQLVTAALRGAVTDPQGAAVSDAEVTITDMGTAFTRTVTASPDGVYNFPDFIKRRAAGSSFSRLRMTLWHS
jgi:hypothetical protein